MKKPRIRIYTSHYGIKFYECEWLNNILGYKVESIDKIFNCLKLAYMLKKDEFGNYINPTDFDKPTFD